VISPTAQDGAVSPGPRGSASSSASSSSRSSCCWTTCTTCAGPQWRTENAHQGGDREKEELDGNSLGLATQLSGHTNQLPLVRSERMARERTRTPQI
jgi:hypothetical protein